MDIKDMFAPQPQPPMGMMEPGNINPHTRPTVHNSDGSISTVRTVSVNVDGREMLIPTVMPDGRIVSDDEAVQHYLSTGQHFGAFRTPDAATQFAQRLHSSQAEEYGSAPPKGEKDRGMDLAEMFAPVGQGAAGQAAAPGLAEALQQLVMRQIAAKYAPQQMAPDDPRMVLSRIEDGTGW